MLDTGSAWPIRSPCDEASIRTPSPAVAGGGLAVGEEADVVPLRR